MKNELTIEAKSGLPTLNLHSFKVVCDNPAGRIAGSAHTKIYMDGEPLDGVQSITIRSAVGHATTVEVKMMVSGVEFESHVVETVVEDEKTR